MAGMLILAAPLTGQDLSRVPPSPEERAFDYWVGTWRIEVNGRVDTTGQEFRVTRLPSGAILERRIQPGSGGAFHSTAIRSFDRAWNRWMYTVCRPGLIRLVLDPPHTVTLSLSPPSLIIFSVNIQ